MSAPSPSFVLVRTAATSTPYRVRSSPSAIAAAAATVIDVAPSAQRQGEPTLFAIPASLRGVWAPESPAWSVQLKPLESKGVSASFSSDGRHIVLNGPSTAAVRQAVQQLTFAAGRLQEKQPLTHFLSLPLQHPELVDKLSAWMDGVEAKGIDGEVLVKPAKFHVTLGVLSLVTPEAVEQATQLMQTIGAEVYDTLQTRTCLVKVGGLRLMTNAKEEKKNNWADMMEEDARKEPPPPQQTPRRDEPTPDRAHVVYFDVVEADGSGRFRAMCGKQHPDDLIRIYLCL